MGFVHMVLRNGTNNVQTVGHSFSDVQIHQRELGAKLVLAARIFYAAFIWTSKLTVSEFLKRITVRIWRRAYEIMLQGIRIFLACTFGAVVVATLTECKPFNHYWQVVPDPGAQCRQGYAQLIAMGTCDMITDILLVLFPIPIVMNSGQTWKRKMQLITLFSLSILMIAVTASRIPHVIQRHGRQQYRTVWASCEILASTAVSNAVILGSMLRDKGTKKQKYKYRSTNDSIDGASLQRPTISALRQVGSEEDLFRFLGCKVPEHLKEDIERLPRRAPPALPAPSSVPNDSRRQPRLAKLEMAEAEYESKEDANTDAASGNPVSAEQPLPSPATSTKPLSFFDIGGLLENESKHSLASRSRSTTLADSGAPGTLTQDFAPLSTPAQSRRGSLALLADMDALPTSAISRSSHAHAYGRRHSNAQNLPQGGRNAPTGVLGPMLERHETESSLQDAGGLSGGRRQSLSSHRSCSPPSNPSAAKVEQYDSRRQPHGPNSSAIASQQHAIQRGVEPVASSSCENRPSQQHGPEGMNLHDPGGLLS